MKRNKYILTIQWLELEFFHSNSKKYHSYCKEWLNNLTDEQLIGFEEQRISIITQSKINHL